MDMQTMLRNMATSWIATKRHSCRRRGGPADLGPMLDIRTATGMYVAPIEWSPEADASMDAFVVAIHNVEGTVDGPVTHLAMLSDAYFREWVPTTPEEWEAVKNVGRGSARAAFAAGDLSVKEVLNVVGIEVKTREVRGLMVPYRYGDDGQPAFDAPVTFPDGEIDGLIRDCLGGAAHYFAERA